MDSARFGRALGSSVRGAAKGLYEVVDAAMAPNPNPSPARPAEAPPVSSTAPQATRQTPLQAVAQGAAAYSAQKKAVTREAGKFGRSFLTPFARAGKVLWLEVTGSFFALFALIFVGNIWKYHDAMRLTATNAGAHRSFQGSILAAVIFGYFALSSFARARKRGRARS